MNTMEVTRVETPLRDAFEDAYTAVHKRLKKSVLAATASLVIFKKRLTEGSCTIRDRPGPVFEI